MRASLLSLLLSALAVSVSAAPQYPKLDPKAATPESMKRISSYFNLLAARVQETRALPSAPVCDLSQAQLPAAPSPLPPPSKGLVLKHVAVGRGTQNYTCDAGDAGAAPAQVGALATLFNASCVAASYPELLAALPRAALQFNATRGDAAARQLAPAGLAASGVHYFRDRATPFFDLDAGSLDLGQAPCAKNSSADAPADAGTRGLLGEPAVPWLKLLADDGATGNLREVYRVDTVGGSAPATCEGMASSFQVQYSALYWFYESV